MAEEYVEDRVGSIYDSILKGEEWVQPWVEKFGLSSLEVKDLRYEKYFPDYRTELYAKTVKELREILTELGLSTTGKVAELVVRILDKEVRF